MKQTNVSFRTDSEKLDTLDALANALDRDRSYILNEAINAYLELYRWQIDHIKEGIKQADANDFASEEEVAKIFRRRTQ